MENLTISLRAEDTRQKIACLAVTKDNLLKDSITPLRFGSASASHISKGSSTVSMGTLNAELDTVKSKLAALSEATGAYLERVIAIFEQADAL